MRSSCGSLENGYFTFKIDELKQLGNVLVDPNDQAPAGAVSTDAVNSMVLPTIKTPTAMSDDELEINVDEIKELDIEKIRHMDNSTQPESSRLSSSHWGKRYIEQLK